MLLKMKWYVTIVLACAVSLSLASCSGGKKDAVSQKDPGPLGKYDPILEVTAVRSVDSNTVFENGDTIENNAWTQAIEEDMGIRIKYLWTVPFAQFDQKMNVTIASGDLPDIMPVTAKHFRMLTESDQAEDMTDYLEKYASQDLKDIISHYPMIDGFVKIDGRMMALPQYSLTPELVPVLYIRTDWMKNLNLPEPKSFEDVLAIADAFANRDPDNNGKKDTYGIAASNDIGTAGICQLHGVFAAYGSYLKMWVNTPDGKLAYSGIQPEARTTLEKLQELYKKGILSKEFSVKTSLKASEDIGSGKVGLVYGLNWAPNVQIKNNVMNDSKAQWKAYPAFASGGDIASVMSKYQPKTFYVVRKGYEHPEVAVKYLNEVCAISKRADEYAKFFSDGKISKHNYPLMMVSQPWDNLTKYKQIKEAFEKNDASGLRPDIKPVYDSIQKYQQGDKSNYGQYAIFGEGGSMSIVDQYKNLNKLLVDGFTTNPTPTMVEKSSTLDKMEDEMMLRIILGAPISEFDQFIKNWKSEGGDDITKEVNDWYASRNK